MKKSDLIPGRHIIKTDCGKKYLVAWGGHQLFGVDIGGSDGMYTSNFYLAGDYRDDSNIKIVEVFEIKNVGSRETLCRDDNLRSVWRYTPPVEVTMKEVEEKFGCKVKIVKED